MPYLIRRCLCLRRSCIVLAPRRLDLTFTTQSVVEAIDRSKYQSETERHIGDVKLMYQRLLHRVRGQLMTEL
jgi:hypothetical protein